MAKVIARGNPQLVSNLKSLGHSFILGLLALIVFSSLPVGALARPVISPDEIEAEPEQEALSVPSTSVSSDIANEAEFLSLSKELAGERFSKFVLDVRSGEIYFFDVNVFRLHSDFVFSQIYHQARTPALVRRYNRNYSTQKPEFLLGYLSHQLSSDIWTFAFWEGDTVDPVHVRKAYAKLKKTVYFGDRLHFRPDSTWQERVAGQLKEMPIIGNDELYYRSDRRVLSPGTAVGRLRLLPGTSGVNAESLAPDEIILTGETLGEIPPVAGIISEKFSTPLSKLNLQARMWAIPFVGEKDAVLKYGALSGQIVFLQANDHGFLLREASESERQSAVRLLEKERPGPAHLSVNESVRDIRPLASLRRSDAGAYGIRASMLGEAASRIQDFALAPGVVVPFAFYREHMKDPELRQMMENMISSSPFSEDLPFRRRALESLQRRLVALPLDPNFLQQFRKQLRLQFGEKPLLLRVSTNAELSPEFHGIGELEQLREVHSDSELEAAIGSLWSSAWNFGNVEERLRAGIGPQNIAVALIAQEMPKSSVSGSLLTAHLFDASDGNTFSIRSSNGNQALGSTSSDAEETVLYDFRNKGIRILTHFAGTQGSQGTSARVAMANTRELLITARRAALLAKAARELRTAFPDWGILSIDWYFRGDELWIEQFGSFRP